MPPRAFDRLTTVIEQTGPAIDKGKFAGVQKAALEAKELVVAEVRKVAGPDLRLSGVGRRGARVGARYDIKGQKNPTAIIRALGPMPLIERPIKPHSILPKAVFVKRPSGVRVRQGRKLPSGRRARGGKTALKIGGNLRSRAMHPGVRRAPGSGPFAKGTKKAAERTPQIFQNNFNKALQQAWK